MRNAGGIKGLFPGNTDQLIVAFQFVDHIIEGTDLIRLQNRKTPHRKEGKAIAVPVAFSVPGREAVQIFNMMLYILIRKVDSGISIVGVVKIPDLLHIAAYFLHPTFRNKPYQDRVALGFGKLFVKKHRTQK